MEVGDVGIKYWLGEFVVRQDKVRKMQRDMPN